MFRSTLVAACLLLSALCISAQETDKPPALIGFVTQVTSAHIFYVNGVRVVCGLNTNSGNAVTHIYEQGCPKPAAFPGEKMNIYGRLYRKRATVDATTIQIVPSSLSDVSGSAVVDAPPRRTAKGLLVRADGYWLLIGPTTSVRFESPLHRLADIQANVWIDYKAKLRPDGMLVASKVRIRPNVFTPEEKWKNEKFSKVDPSKVSKDQAQSGASAAIIGPRLKKIPEWKDPPMQARVTLIGEKLVPGYQKSLPNSSSSKLHFRFIVVGGIMSEAAVPLPDGTVLVGYKAIQRLKTDPRIAALLSFEIAAILEHEAYRMAALQTGLMTAGSGSILTAELLSPGIGLALFAGSRAAQNAMLRKVFGQCIRVSFQLMHDGGYDLNETVPAWWLLSSNKTQPTAKTPLNPYLAILCQSLTAIWHAPSWAAVGQQTATSNPSSAA